MAKRHILIDPAQPSTSKQSRPPPRTNWELCILCQAETDEPLQCPLRSTMKPSGSGYASLTEDHLQFKGLRHMPMELNVNRLDDGDGVEATLRTHSAQWHKKCRLKFNKKMFDQQSRAESQLQDSNLVPVLQPCTHDQQLPTGFHSQPSLSVSSAISQLALQTCTKQLQRKLTRTFGDVPLNWGTLNCWPSCLQET